ncbi:MAG: hypothetical protein EOO78_25295, partial [Oxalobacteraceae bacterium]
MTNTTDTTNTERNNERNPGPLAGIKVIEMGTLIAGPFGARLLAEFGAEVMRGTAGLGITRFALIP